MNDFGALVFLLTMEGLKIGIIIWIGKKICDYMKS